MSGKSFTREEVALHNKPNDAWIIIAGKVYDVSKFLSQHPGGSKILLQVAGKDATTQFQSLHQPTVLGEYANLEIGVIRNSKKLFNNY